MSSSDSEYEEEEAIVLVKLHGVIDTDIFSQESLKKFKLLGVDTEKPVLQLEDCVFSGEYEQTMGTALIFEESEKRIKKCDPLFCKKPPRMLQFAYKTNKALNMKRVFVTEKIKTETRGSDTGMVRGEHLPGNAEISVCKESKP